MPRQFRWEQLQYSLPTEEQVKAWFEGTDRNLAVITGKMSRLLVLDLAS